MGVSQIQALHRRHQGHSGVVDQDVSAAQIAAGPRCQRFERFLARHIADLRQAGRALIAQHLPDRFEPRHIDIGQQQSGANLGKSAGHGRANARSGTSDYDGLVGKVIQAVAPIAWNACQSKLERLRRKRKV